MRFKTDYKLEKFILGARFDALPEAVQTRLRGCAIDLMGALIVGSRSRQFDAGLCLARRVYSGGDVAVVGAPDKLSFMGASAAMGHSANAYDIDDGHNMIRAHPGAAFVGGVLAAAYERDASFEDYLMALLVAYETTVRSGLAMMDYYEYPHSSGSFGSPGVAAGVGRLYGMTVEQLNNAIAVAEFHAPLVPTMNSAAYPSMNKDGVPFGVMIGALAVADTLCGFTGRKHLLESEPYDRYLDDLGRSFEVMNLYFKPYPCCRWAHAGIDACLELMRAHSLTPADIASVTIRTFHRATLLSMLVPKTTEEAQYNISYPIAAAIVHGGFGFAQVSEEGLGDKNVEAMMGRLSFVTDEQIDALFPKRRICRAQINTVDGRTLISRDCEPSGEAHENIGIGWLSDKFLRITESVLTDAGRRRALELLQSDLRMPIRSVVDEINRSENWAAPLVGATKGHGASD